MIKIIKDDKKIDLLNIIYNKEEDNKIENKIFSEKNNIKFFANNF